MKLIELQTMMDGDQVLRIEGHDGYCLSSLEDTQVKFLENSQYKDCEIDLIHGGLNCDIWVKIEGVFRR